MNILLIDDEPAILEFLKRFLLKKKHHIQTESSGITALELIKKDPGKIDLIFTDVRMPGMNGIDVIKAINKIGIQIPIIMVTTENHESILLEAMSLGAKDYLIKPIEQELLIEKVSALL